MSIATFLDCCSNEEGIITIIRSGVGRVYSGPIGVLRRNESESVTKLISKKIDRFFVDIIEESMTPEILITIGGSK